MFVRDFLDDKSTVYLNAIFQMSHMMTKKGAVYTKGLLVMIIVTQYITPTYLPLATYASP